MSDDWHNTVGYMILISVGSFAAVILLCIAAAFLLP